MNACCGRILQVLVLKHERAVLGEIEAHLTTCGSVEAPLTMFAEEAARSLLGCSVALEQGKTVLPYSAAVAVFSILTCGKEEGSLLFQLGHSMVLHILRKYSTSIVLLNFNNVNAQNLKADLQRNG